MGSAAVATVSPLPWRSTNQAQSRYEPAGDSSATVNGQENEKGAGTDGSSGPPARLNSLYGAASIVAAHDPTPAGRIRRQGTSGDCLPGRVLNNVAGRGLLATAYRPDRERRL